MASRREGHAVTGALLPDALMRIAQEIDSAFDALLPVPSDARARLIEAMRYAAIGGGKRLRPLLLSATAEMFGVHRTAAVSRRMRHRGDPCLFADPR